MTQAPKTAPVVGTALTLRAGLQCILAPNASPMTYWGTNTYILGDQSVVIIDPGPDDDAHLTALLNAIGSRDVACILVTHSHLDHSALAPRLSRATRAPVVAFGASGAGRSPTMSALIAQGLTGGGEGIDMHFAPDKILHDGATVAGDWGEITAIHTPGHMSNHLCFQWNDVIFTGDHVMDWASSLISPPDGDLTQFMRACRHLATFSAQSFYPAHGAPVTAPAMRLDWLINHRLAREAAILSALAHGPQTIPALTESIYAPLDPSLGKAAQRNVFAHLIDLTDRGQTTATPSLAFSAKYEIMTPPKRS